MRTVHFSALFGAFLGAIAQVAVQLNANEIRVLSPGVVYNAGLLDLADAFTKETSTKVTSKSASPSAAAQLAADSAWTGIHILTAGQTTPARALCP